LGRKCNF